MVVDRERWPVMYGCLPSDFRERKDTMMLELYHGDMSVCAQKARFALAEKGLEWKSHRLRLGAGDQQQPAYVKLNPNAVVPTLVDDGTVIIESTVINEYIDDAYPDSPLRPADPRARARMRLWTKRLDDSVHGACGVLSAAVAIRFQRLEKTPEELRAFLQRIPDPVRRERNREIIEKGLDSSYLADSVKCFDRLLADMETTLGDGPWLAGEAFSLADVGYAPYLTRLEHLMFQWMWENRPRVGDWFSRIQKMPGYKKSHVDWFDPSYLTLMKEKGIEATPRIHAIIRAS